jgi:hypothetical protein
MDAMQMGESEQDAAPIARQHTTKKPAVATQTQGVPIPLLIVAMMSQDATQEGR